MSEWKKIPHRPESKRKPEPWLEVREGVRTITYRVNLSDDGRRFRQKIKGDFGEDWKRAERAGERMILRWKFGERGPDRAMIRSEVLLDEILRLKTPPARHRDTYNHCRHFHEKHLKPWLNEYCPYAAEFNETHWARYKTDFRLKSPTGQLANHWKYLVEFAKYAFEQGVIPRRIRLAFDEKKEDFRERGQVIPDEELKLFLAEANSAWRARVILGRIMGQRPGLIRKLRKDQVNLETGLVTVEKLDSKNRHAYTFYIASMAVAILKARADLYPDSPYFFPSELDHSKPMDKHLNGWHAAWARAGIKKRYTPHDLRHTRLTELFRMDGVNQALACYTHDLSLEVAMETYIHYSAEDTLPLAENSGKVGAALIGEVA